MSLVPAGRLRPEIVAERIAAVRHLLERRDAAAIALTTRRDFAWLTLGGLNHVLLASEAGVAPIVVTRDEAVVLAPVNEYERIADEELAGLPLRAVSVPWWDGSALKHEQRALAGGGTPLSGDDVADELEALRTALEPIEHERMRALALSVNTAVDEALAAVAAGRREEQLAGELGERLAGEGARLPVILVAADERISHYRHPIPTDTPIRQRVMVVVVAERWGLHVAATQFRELTARAPEIERRAVAVGQVAVRMREATRPGRTLGDVLAVAQAAYAESGMADEWELHHQGGTIGYAARERIARPGDNTPIRPGMAFAWNPSAVGFKAEETFYLDGAGSAQLLTTTR